MRTSFRVLTVTNMYPTPTDPVHGVFVASQVQSLERAGATVLVEVIDGRRTKFDYLDGVRRVRRLAATGRFDVVHAHYGLTGFVSSFQDLPLVVSFCGDDLNGTSDGRGGITLKSRVARRLGYWAAMRADSIICKSERLRLALPRRVDRARAHVIANGVDLTKFAPGNRALARHKLGLPPDELLILFPHSVRQRNVKRFDLAEAAVDLLHVQWAPVRLWIVNGVSQGMMPDYYRAADCLLLTSDSEGSPNVVKEALCCDLPVVSVDVGDVRFWMDLAPGCRLVSREPTDIAEGLRMVLEERARIDASSVRAQIGEDQIARRILGVYEEATRGARDNASVGESR
jgi:glycosyltransferase involved in cell wall biosynthesis